MASPTLPSMIAAAAEQAGLLEVDVAVDETGQHEPAVDVGTAGFETQAAAPIAAIRPPERRRSRTGCAECRRRRAAEGPGQRRFSSSSAASQRKRETRAAPDCVQVEHGLFRLCRMRFECRILVFRRFLF